MDNKQSLDLLQNRPKGLINQLKYFEFELSKLEEKKGNTDLKQRIRREIENLRFDISRYDELLDIQVSEVESLIKNSQKILDKSISEMEAETKSYPYWKLYLLASVVGVLISLLIQSLIIPNYILLIVSASLLALSTFFFYRKIELPKIWRGIDVVRKTFEMMKIVESKISVYETVKQEIFFAHKTNDTAKHKNNYFENRDWLEKKFLEFERKGESQNKSTKLTQEAYEKEFGLKPPSTNTILRYVGRIQ